MGPARIWHDDLSWRHAVPRRVAAAIVMLAASSAMAQNGPPPTPGDPFPGAPLVDAGQNQAQRDMALSIERMCPNLLAVTNPSGETDGLLEICGNLVGNNGELGGRFNGYMLPEAELNDVMQALSGEEYQATQQRIGQVNDSTVGDLAARLSAVRAGTAGPLSISGLTIDTGDRVLALEDLADLTILPAQFEDGGFLSKLGLFVTGSTTFGDKEPTGEITGFDFDTYGITVGADYRISDQLAAGLAVGYSRFDADFDTAGVRDTASPSGQELESDGVQLAAFGSFFPTDQLFVDAIASVGWQFYDSTRRIVIDSRNPAEDDVSATATGDFDAVHFGVATNIGYSTQVAGANLTPLVRLEYLHAEIDGFTESSDSPLELEFDDSDADSLTINLGVEADYPISTPFGIISPNVRAEYVHEFIDEDDGGTLAYANDTTDTLDDPQVNAFCDRRPCSAFSVSREERDQDYGIIGAGVVATLPLGFAAFVDWSTFIGLSNFDVHTVNVGLRKEF
jgi:outer membrane autotransporter protein